MDKSTKCKKCGAADLFWRMSKNGKWYLCEPSDVQFGERAHKLIPFAHKCAVRPNAHAAAVAKAESAVRGIKRLLNESDLSNDSYTAFTQMLAQYESELKELKGDK